MNKKEVKKLLDRLADSDEPYKARDDAKEEKNAEAVKEVIHSLRKMDIEETPYMREKRILLGYNTSIDFKSDDVNETLQAFLDNWDECSRTNLMYSYIKEALKSI